MAKQRLKKMVITVTPQTAYHLRDMAAMCKYKSVGRVVDKLVREKRISMNEWKEGAMRNPDAIPTLTPPNEWVSVEERLPEDEARQYIEDDLDGIGYLYPCLLTYKSPNTERNPCGQILLRHYPKVVCE